MKNISQQVTFSINVRREHGQASVGLQMLPAISFPPSSQAQPPLPDYQDTALPPNTSSSLPGGVSCLSALLQAFYPHTRIASSLCQLRGHRTPLLSWERKSYLLFLDGTSGRTHHSDGVPSSVLSIQKPTCLMATAGAGLPQCILKASGRQ